MLSPCVPPLRSHATIGSVNALDISVCAYGHEWCPIRKATPGSVKVSPPSPDRMVKKGISAFFASVSGKKYW